MRPALQGEKQEQVGGGRSAYRLFQFDLRAADILRRHNFASQRDRIPVIRILRAFLILQRSQLVPENLLNFPQQIVVNQRLIRVGSVGCAFPMFQVPEFRPA